MIMSKIAPLIYHYNQKISDTAIKNVGRVLDVGCGSTKMRGSVGIDKIKSSAVDIVWDMDKFPWPLEDNFFDLIIFQHSLEHLVDVVRVMEEVSRLGKNGSRVIVNVPFFRNLDAFSDITHKHFFTSHSMDYFISNKRAFNFHYSNISFDLAGVWFGWPGPSKSFLRGMIKGFINKFPNFYENYLSIIYPVKNITWELIIKK